MLNYFQRLPVAPKTAFNNVGHLNDKKLFSYEFSNGNKSGKYKNNTFKKKQVCNSLFKNIKPPGQTTDFVFTY